MSGGNEDIEDDIVVSDDDPTSLLDVSSLFIYYVGLLCFCFIVIKICYQIAVGFRNFVWATWFPHNLRYYGEWAVVTGCTDGIGKSYVKELASRGFNIILISRTMEKLARVAGEIEKNWGVRTQIIQADFSKGRPIYDRIREQIQGKDIGILVNNVGIVQQVPCSVSSMSEDEVWGVINVNVCAMTSMTRMVLPLMMEKQRGAIVNVSSASAIAPTPLIAVYSATKSYIEYLSTSLEMELKSTGITVQTILPFYVATNMTKFNDRIGKPGMLVPTADQYARSALNTLGFADKTTGYWTHGLQFWFCNLVSSHIWTLLSYFWNWKLRQETLRSASSSVNTIKVT